MPKDYTFDNTGFSDFDAFSVEMITRIADVLEDTIGLEDLQGLVNLVAYQLGRKLSRNVRDQLGGRALNQSEVGELCCELKSRIGGHFEVTSSGDGVITLKGHRCPFQDNVKGRESLCLMTSGVFGRIAADNLGHSVVTIDEAIARGHDHCTVTIRINPNGDDQSNGVSLFEREYFPESTA